jgi:hypothetical protein
VNIGETLEIYELEIKHSKQFRASSTWEISLATLIDNNKCIKERIMMGNKAYYANGQLVNSSLISRNNKLQIYRMSVRPAVTCGSESWTLTVGKERASAVVENTAENIWASERKQIMENSTKR